MNNMIGFGISAYIMLLTLYIVVFIDLYNRSIDNNVEEQTIIIDTIYIDTCYVN